MLAYAICLQRSDSCAGIEDDECNGSDINDGDGTRDDAVTGESSKNVTQGLRSDSVTRTNQRQLSDEQRDLAGEDQAPRLLASGCRELVYGRSANGVGLELIARIHTSRISL